MIFFLSFLSLFSGLVGGEGVPFPNHAIMDSQGAQFSQTQLDYRCKGNNAGWLQWSSMMDRCRWTAFTLNKIERIEEKLSPFNYMFWPRAKKHIPNSRSVQLTLKYLLFSFSFSLNLSFFIELQHKAQKHDRKKQLLLMLFLPQCCI